jgi:transcription initiation factor TFIIIB Brf1 subunit/transcription initiation factor TFIIB
MKQNSFKFHPSIFCPLCNATSNLVTDPETIETICVNCGSINTNDELQDIDCLFQYNLYYL